MSKRRFSRFFWWFGVIAITAFLSASPYWIWNAIGAGKGWTDFFRVPVAPNAVFDSYLYFQQMSLLKAGIVTGAFNWFTQPIVWLMQILPRASIPEIWILSRWMTLLLLACIGPWCFQRFSHANRNLSRWFMACFWLSFLLVISLRPGVFSWYLPFGFLGFGLLAYFTDALEQKRWMRALPAGMAAIGILYIYPWFFLFGFTFIVSIVATTFAAKHRLWLGALLSSAVLVICTGAILIASQTIALTIPSSLAFYERNGIGFAHIPLISNTILASALWLYLLTRLRASYPNAPVTKAAWFWIVMLALWLSPPLIGLDLLNDHFIIVAAMLSWMTLAVFAASFERSDSVVTQAQDRVSLGIALFALTFFLYILQKSLNNVGQFEPYTIHLSIWLALAVAGFLHWLQTRHQSINVLWRRIRWPLLFVCFLIGLIGLVTVLQRSMKEMPELWQRLPTVTWIQAHIPPGEAICSDPGNASMYAAHAGHATYPSESNLMFPISDAELQRRIVIIGTAYDTIAAHDADRFPFLINGVRAVACDQFAKPAAFLRGLGMPGETVDRFIGCRQERAAFFERETMEAMRTSPLDAGAFQTLCPWVVIPDDHKLFWHLPDAYEETRVNEGVSIWHATNF